MSKDRDKDLFLRVDELLDKYIPEQEEERKEKGRKKTDQKPDKAEE
ncbi:MAG: hypothetical protein U9M90_03390 [Patescibacteria group bacterium]|nr:hypothetical protein [Patescibacteria group bacterium]